MKQHDTETLLPGFWESPLSAEDLAQGSRKLSAVTVSENTIYWTESRASEGGRRVLMQAGLTKAGVSEPQVIIEAPYNVRTRVHEYGGGEYLATKRGILFADASDQSWYIKRKHNTAPEKFLSGEDRRLRYADLSVYEDQFVAVQEKHTHGSSQVENSLVLGELNQENAELNTLVSGGDFYSNPRFRADGQALLFLTWDHPNMPWDGSTLKLMTRDLEGNWTEPKTLAGGKAISIYQPQWGPDGWVYYVSDISGWWNLWRCDPENADKTAEPLLSIEAEFGLPQWVFATQSYDFLANGNLVAIANAQGRQRLLVINTALKTVEQQPCPFSDYGGYIAALGEGVVILGANAKCLPQVTYYSLSQQQVSVVRRESDFDWPQAWMSYAETLSVKRSNGLGEVHAFFYPAVNPEVVDSSVQSPLLVFCHSGPTASASRALSLKVQFWTSRGFAVLDVNYGGSTGYGRDYRERLRGQWGVVDVEDCLACIESVCQQSSIDPDKIFIRGSSAGGYTVLRCLQQSERFAGGTSVYGVADLMGLVSDTHKFEQHYTEGLVGSYPSARDTYESRSPRLQVAEMRAPVLILQGKEDPVVPVSQAREMVAAMNELGLKNHYVEFPGEGHGFKKAETISSAYNEELEFYQTILSRIASGTELAPDRPS